MGVGVMQHPPKSAAAPCLSLGGVAVYQGWLSAEDQAAMLAELREVAREAPPFSPETPYGRKMSVQMTSAGTCGWYSDRRGYRYAEKHPSGAAWPPVPPSVLAVWQALATDLRDPDCCLINFYGEGARMGMHQDRDEADFSWPVLSISLGDDALFRVGGTTRGGKTQSIWLTSGDVVVIGGAARLAYHGVDRIRFGSSRLLSRGGRINVTARVVS